MKVSSLIRALQHLDSEMDVSFGNVYAEAPISDEDYRSLTRREKKACARLADGTRVHMHKPVFFSMGEPVILRGEFADRASKSNIGDAA